MLIVQKFGGATLATPEKVKLVARRLAQLKEQNIQVLAVVSAMGQTTNQLIDLAHQVSPHPQLRELDMLLSVGERMSMSLVAIALHDLNQAAISFTGSQAGIITNDNHLNAMIKDVRAFRVAEALQKNQIVILAGFQGVSEITKEITTLGRGGSDTSAVAIAAFLNAHHCEILKDVPSIFSADPKKVPQAKPIQNLHFDHLLEMTFWGAKVLHYRSVELAKIKNVPLYVGPAHEDVTQNSKAKILNSSGTTINGDFMFESSHPLAINSHSQVFEIQISCTNYTEGLLLFNETLKKENIATPQILMGQFSEANNKLILFITAPSENLELLYNLKTQKISLTNSKLSSVSLTCTGSSLNETLVACIEKLNTAKINPHSFLQSAMSLNFILNTEEKDLAITKLHELII